MKTKEQNKLTELRGRLRRYNTFLRKLRDSDWSQVQDDRLTEISDKLDAFMKQEHIKGV